MFIRAGSLPVRNPDSYRGEGGVGPHQAEIQSIEIGWIFLFIALYISDLNALIAQTALSRKVNLSTFKGIF